MNDWSLLKEVYGLETIKEVSLNLRSLDAVTLSFLATLFKIDKKKFRCYKHKQLFPTYWNFLKSLKKSTNFNKKFQILIELIGIWNFLQVIPFYLLLFCQPVGRLWLRF